MNRVRHTLLAAAMVLFAATAANAQANAPEVGSLEYFSRVEYKNSSQALWGFQRLCEHVVSQMKKGELDAEGRESYLELLAIEEDRADLAIGEIKAAHAEAAKYIKMLEELRVKINGLIPRIERYTPGVAAKGAKKKQQAASAVSAIMSSAFNDSVAQELANSSKLLDDIGRAVNEGKLDKAAKAAVEAELKAQAANLAVLLRTASERQRDTEKAVKAMELLKAKAVELEKKVRAYEPKAKKEDYKPRQIKK